MEIAVFVFQGRTLTPWEEECFGMVLTHIKIRRLILTTVHLPDC